MWHFEWTKIARLGSRPLVIGGTAWSVCTVHACAYARSPACQTTKYGRADRMTDDGTPWATERWLARHSLALAHVFHANTYPPPPYAAFPFPSFIPPSLSLSSLFPFDPPAAKLLCLSSLFSHSYPNFFYCLTLFGGDFLGVIYETTHLSAERILIIKRTTVGKSTIDAFRIICFSC